jgi:hypothetical protein
MRTKPLLGIKATAFLIMFFLVTFISCKKGITNDGANLPPYYNLDVALSSGSPKSSPGSSSGFIKFRQNPDTARIVTLETWVYHLEPNHAYILQRAVNPITDSNCSSTAWLSLGLGTTPQSIITDANGNAHENLFRNLTAIARETQFRIHFQIIDSITATPVLFSDCTQFTVR